jgi:hypothetical protein
VWFAHECAYGLGYRLDGIHVSTGLNRVGGVGKRPGDPGFRDDIPVTGTANKGTFFGPLTTWVIASAATAAFVRSSKGKKGEVFAAAAITAALQRLLPLLPFFASAPFGKVVYQDEVEWAGRHVPEFDFPMSLDAFVAELRERPGEFLRTPMVYAWPVVSVTLCGSCLVITGRHMRRTNHVWGRARHSIAIPVAAWIVAAAAVEPFDRVFRINW